MRDSRGIWYGGGHAGSGRGSCACILLAPPRYAPARVMQIMKSICARELFARFPWLRRKLWGGELWGDGYFVRSVGDQVTADVIRRYIEYQKAPKDIQLELWDKGS